jgi:hypothetical protein
MVEIATLTAYKFCTKDFGSGQGKFFRLLTPSVIKVTKCEKNFSFEEEYILLSE